MTVTRSIGFRRSARTLSEVCPTTCARHRPGRYVLLVCTDDPYLMDQGIAERTLREHKQETAIDGSMMPLHADGNSCLFANLPRQNRTMQPRTPHRSNQSKWLSTEEPDKCEKDPSHLELRGWTTCSLRHR